MARHHVFSISTIVVCAIVSSLTPPAAIAQESRPSARQLLSEALTTWADLVEGKGAAASHTLVAHCKLVRSRGLPDEVAGLELDLAYQAPDRLRLEGTAGGFTMLAGRDGNDLWVDEPQKKFAVLGKPGVALFRAEPDRLDQTRLSPFALPLSRLKLSMLPYTVAVEQEESEKIGGQPCDVLRIGLLPEAAAILRVPDGRARLWLRQGDHLPLRLTYTDGNQIDVQVDVSSVRLVEAWEPQKWQLHAAPGEDVETTAVSHLVRFLAVGPKILTEKVAPLGEAAGERQLVAAEGKGRLELIDGTRVLFLKGSADEMGRQQGTLLKSECRRICNHILYGVGVASSFDQGKWFFREVENAEARLEPYMDKRYLAEMDAMADAAHLDRQEARLANFFPELFHCTGFSLFGQATRDGHMYHGRVLDYLRGVGLEQNAVVMVYQPDYGNAWVNIGYAGFIGSVTAMNEKGISIGEMGGNGYGDWDGKPMAELLREVMEKANTLEDAIRIMRDAPRTCHYYYVISDGKAMRAVGIEATPGEFRVVHPGEAVPQLPHGFADAVLLSAGDRYETLCQRVKDGYGSFDAEAARRLMSRPVCMTSNIHSVLFEPDTLDFWVANADSTHVASAARFTHYNLRDLLNSKPPKSWSSNVVSDLLHGR